MSTEKFDERMKTALTVVKPDSSEAEVAELRKWVGTARWMYRPGHRVWNWLFDAEYTTIGPAPFLWIGTAGLAVILAVAIVLIGVTR